MPRKIRKRAREIEILASDFGATGDGVTDDTAAIQAALDRTGQLLQAFQNNGLSGPATCKLGGGTYVISSTLTVRNGTSLVGDTKNPPYPNEFSGFGSGENKYTGTQITCVEPFTGTEAINLEADNTSVEDIILDGHQLNCGNTYTQIKIRNDAENRTRPSVWYRFNVATPIDGANPDFRQQAFEVWNPEIPYFRTNEYMEYHLSVVGGEGPFKFVQGDPDTHIIVPASASISWTGNTISGSAGDFSGVLVGWYVDTDGNGIVAPNEIVAVAGDGRSVTLNHVVDVATNNQELRFYENRLPKGLKLDPDGLIHGTAFEEATSPVRTFFPNIFIYDSRTSPGPRQSWRTFTVRTMHEQIFDQSCNDPTAGAAFSYTFKARHGGGTNLRWRATGLPDFMSLDEITGELTAPNTTTDLDVLTWEWKLFLYAVDEENENSWSDWQLLDSRYYKSELRFGNGGIRVLAPSVNAFTSGEAVSFQWHANGGYGSYTWTVNHTRTNAEFGGSNATTTTASSPFNGITLNSTTGEFTGTPTTAGQNQVYVNITSTTDPDIFYEAKFFFRSRNPGDVGAPITRSLPSASLGQPYNYTYKVNSGSGQPYKFEAIGLPTGLTMDPNTGVISGTPAGASYVDGIRIQWSCNVRNCSIRGFRSGGGIVSRSSSNVHRIKSVLISICDSGIRSINQTWDSHFEDLYIYNCRTGLSFGPGTAGNTFSNSRIEFIHEWGLAAQTCHENDFSQCYFDTCGFSAVRLVDSRNNVFSGNRFFRSGRNLRGTGTMRNTKADREYSNHMYLEQCEAIVITGNAFDAGSASEGNTLFVRDDDPHDCIRPYTGIRMNNCKEVTIVGNGLAGCTNDAVDADLGTFGRNDYYGYHAAENGTSDREFAPRSGHLHEKTIYLPNQSFQIWQRDTAFAIPPQPAGPSGSGASSSFPIADCWTLSRGGNAQIDQTISVTKGTDGPIGDGTYLSIVKPPNTTTAPQYNSQFLEIFNNKSPDIAHTSNRNVTLSFYGKSANNNNCRIKLNVYPDAFFYGQKLVYSETSSDITLNNQWKRYSYRIEIPDFSYAEGNLGAIAQMTVFFQMPFWDEDIDVQVTGFQVDPVDITPFPDDVRAKSYQEEKAFCQKFYQHSKDWENGEFMGSWSDTYRYDVNGTFWQSGYQVAYSPSTAAGALRTKVEFENPLGEHPGDAETNSGALPNFKVLNPARLAERTNADKYQMTNGIEPYIENATKRSIEVSGRNSTTAPTADTTYRFHWIYTTYSQDLDPAGGGYG